jgi:predicted transcriptional regulator
MADSSAARLLISVHPRFAELILAGTKRVELRRVRPSIRSGDEVVIYETSPTCAVVCKARVGGVVAAHPDVLWKRCGRLAGVSHDEFFEYFGGRECGYAIKLEAVVELPRPIELRQLRRAVPGFAPPQSYHYLRQDRPRDQRLAACWYAHSSTFA